MERTIRLALFDALLVTASAAAQQEQRQSVLVAAKATNDPLVLGAEHSPRTHVDKTAHSRGMKTKIRNLQDRI
jgi:hypothetical protein